MADNILSDFFSIDKVKNYDKKTFNLKEGFINKIKMIQEKLQDRIDSDEDNSDVNTEKFRDCLRKTAEFIKIFKKLKFEEADIIRALNKGFEWEIKFEDYKTDRETFNENLFNTIKNFLNFSLRIHGRCMNLFKAVNFNNNMISTYNKIKDLMKLDKEKLIDVFLGQKIYFSDGIRFNRDSFVPEMILKDNLEYFNNLNSSLSLVYSPNSNDDYMLTRELEGEFHGFSKSLVGEIAVQAYTITAHLKKMHRKFSDSIAQLRTKAVDFVLDDDAKLKFSEFVLKNTNYKNLKFLGQGSFNTVFAALSPEGKEVAARVVVTDQENSLKSEIWAVEELSNLENDLKEYKKKGKVVDNEKLIEHFKKYNNVPVYRGNDEYDYYGNTLYYAVFEAPLAVSDLLEDKLEKSPDSFPDVPVVDFKELRKIAKGVLKGLQTMHKAGKVHLDIKPQNMVKKSKDTRGATGKFIYQIIDHGLMEDIKTIKDVWNPELQRALKNVGSKGYQAPEQFDPKEEVQAENLKKIDIFSVGASLFQMYAYQRYGKSYIAGRETTKLLLEVPWDESLKQCKDYNWIDEYNFLAFCRRLSARDPKKRPSATKALQDPFLVKNQ